MKAVLDIPEAPPPELRFRHRVALWSSLRQVWRSRELVRTLAEREYCVRYKQAFLGIAWAIMTPLALMLVFTLVFQHVARIKTGDAPYPLTSYLGLLPWTFFATSLNQGGLSLVTNVNLLNKVYCPREVFPVASMCVAAVETLIAVSGLVVLFAIFQEAPKITSLWLPVLILVQVAFTLGVTLAASITIVYLRDLRYALPVILQFGLFATPVAYTLADVPEKLRPWMVGLNALAAVIDGYRRTVLNGQAPQWDLLGIAAITSTIVLFGGYALFKRFETGIADVA